jgi:hypothetical protein
VNLPNRDFWLAPTQREASLAFLAAHGAALGCLMWSASIVVTGRRQLSWPV